MLPGRSPSLDLSEDSKLKLPTRDANTNSMAQHRRGSDTRSMSAVVLGLLLAPMFAMADPPCPLDMEKLLPLAPYTGSFSCGGSTTTEAGGRCESLAGKVAVVTGASTGLGRGVADRLAQAGMKVIGTSRNPGQYTVKCTYKNPGDKCAPDGWQLWQMDQTSDASVNAFIQRVKDTYGRIDLLVLNAGRGYGQNTFKGGCNDMGPLMEVMNVNFWGTVRVLKAAVPLLPKSGYARVVIIASTAAFVSIQGGLPYAASKASVAAIAEEWLYEYYGAAAGNVKVVTVFPGSMLTDFARNTIPACSSQADSSGKLLAREWQQWEQWQYGPQPTGPAVYLTAQQGGEGVFRVAANPNPGWRYLLNNEKSAGFIRRRICTHLAAPMEQWPKAYN